MQRTSSAADDRSESPTELIARISAEHGSPDAATGRHRRAAAVVTTDRKSRRSLTRRMAPLAVGAVVMLIATTVATIVRPTQDTALADPDLSSSLLRSDTTTLRGLAPTSPTAAPTTSEPPAVTSRPAAPTAGTNPRVTASPVPAPRRTPAAPARAPAPAAGLGDGTQAAAAHGWTLVGGDEFNGARSPKWGVYQGGGHAGNGTRTANALSVENGSLVIRGDARGATGGLAWSENQRFGKWEMRARFPTGDKQYHPVLILWPEGQWPQGGEIDFAETNSAAGDVSFFLHYSASNQQKYAKKAIDLTQWHNYAVEWVDGRVTGYIDGVKWFESTAGNTLPPGRMHPTIQLDYFPSGGALQPTEMYVDYMRIYR